MNEIKLLDIPGFKSLETKFGITSYVEELTEPEGNVRSLPTNNFILRTDGKLLATNDFRVILKDHVGRVPEDVMYNVASMAYLYVGGLITYEVAYAYITKRMLEYGTPFMEFRFNGYLTIDIYRNKTDVNYKSRLQMSEKGTKF